ncbi:MAG TPA: GNAT family N-acetyltransferase [Gemmatimonadaceae bacterium]|nr:GNAT family N-acetyltransferase [Gemmatimonadaceae bacterium]
MDSDSIEIRPLASQAELRACVQLQEATWGQEFGDIVPTSILKVAQRIGGVVLGAFDGGDLVGFVFGLTGVERGRIVHWSDMLAVRRDARNLGIGRRLKEEQRRAALEVGAEVIYWTFDPLVARNAHLNVNRLGARVSEYVENMYGLTDSVLHGLVPTDRLIVAWPTHDDEIERRLFEVNWTVSSPDSLQAPIATPDWISDVEGASILPHCVRVEIPGDAEALLRTSPEDAARWRNSVRTAMRWGLTSGYSVNGFLFDESRDRGFYVMTKASRSSLPAARA